MFVKSLDYLFKRKNVETVFVYVANEQIKNDRVIYVQIRVV